MVRWYEDDFNIEEWDELGENDLTQSVRQMLEMGVIKSDLVYMLLSDCVSQHMYRNTAERRIKKLEKRIDILKGKP